MAYPQKLLSEGETVVLDLHQHWKVVFVPILGLLVSLTAAGYLLAQDYGSTTNYVILGIEAAVIIGFFLIPVLRWRTTHFVVTTRRVLIREGVFTRNGIDIPMSRINSVQFRKTFFERLFGVGTLVIESASDEPLEFHDVPGVEQVHALLYKEVADET